MLTYAFLIAVKQVLGFSNAVYPHKLLAAIAVLAGVFQEAVWTTAAFSWRFPVPFREFMGVVPWATFTITFNYVFARNVFAKYIHKLLKYLPIVGTQLILLAPRLIARVCGRLHCGPNRNDLGVPALQGRHQALSLDVLPETRRRGHGRHRLHGRDLRLALPDRVRAVREFELAGFADHSDGLRAGGARDLSVPQSRLYGRRQIDAPDSAQDRGKLYSAF